MATTKHRSKKSSRGVAVRWASSRLRARMGTVMARPSADELHPCDAVAFQGEGQVGRAGVGAAADPEADDGGAALLPYGHRLEGHLPADELGAAPLADAVPAPE